MSDVCNAFEMTDKNGQREPFRNLVFVESYGSECNGNGMFTTTLWKGVTNEQKTHIIQ